MMTHFFDSTESIAEGLGFPLFGFGHLCWLAAFVVFAVVCSRIYKKSDAAKRQRIRYIFVALLLLDEAIKVIGLSVQGLFLQEVRLRKVALKDLQLQGLRLLRVVVHRW